MSARRSAKRIAATKEGFRSDFEKQISDQAKEDSIEVRYEPAEARIKWVDKVKTYTPDFVLNNGIIVEAKGRLTVHDRKKHVCIKAQHHLLDIRFIFQYNNPITKGSKTRYTDWADKNGFQWAMKTIPPEWAKEPTTMAFNKESVG